MVLSDWIMAGENLSVVLSRICGIFGAGLSMAMKSRIVSGIEHWEAFLKEGLCEESQYKQ